MSPRASRQARCGQQSIEPKSVSWNDRVNGKSAGVVGSAAHVMRPCMHQGHRYAD